MLVYLQLIEVTAIAQNFIYISAAAREIGEVQKSPYWNYASKITRDEIIMVFSVPPMLSSIGKVQ